MQKYEAIEKAIQENDIKSLRESIGSICYTCRDFSNGEFDEIVAYAISKGIQLMDSSLEGNLISASKIAFTDEDFARAIFELKRNFCKERIADVKKIGTTLYYKAPEKKAQTAEETGTPPNANCHQTSNTAKLEVAGLVAVGVALVAIAVILVILLKK